MNDFYTTHSSVTNPGKYAHLLDNLPADLPGIANIAQGLIYHYVGGRHFFGWVPPQERLIEINTRNLEQMLACLLEKDNRPFSQARDFPNRLIGCCRDFSLIACTILRHQGRAARLRYGFASYFDAGYWGDHVVVEVWNGERWQRFDPQLAGLRDWGVDIFDLAPADFASGGHAWQMCCNGEADPLRFGLGAHELEVHGWMFIRERLQLDIAALNKVELLCWDTWDELSENDENDQHVLDSMAALSLNPDTTALRAVYAERENWRIPPIVTCFHPAVGTTQVEIAIS